MFVCVYNFTFIIAVPFSPKYVSSILCIYGLFAAEGKQQGSDTLEAVNCRSPRWACLYLQIKEVFFHFGVVFLFCSAVSNICTRPLGVRNTTDTGVKKI